MYIVMLDDKFISEGLVFNNINDVRTYLLFILGNSVTVHTLVEDTSSSTGDLKIGNTETITLDELIKVLCEPHTLIIEDQMFAPYAYGRIDIIKLKEFVNLEK